MNQSESGRGVRITCPACGQEGQRITCTSGSKSEVIVYHPKKRFHTVCHVTGNGNAGNEGEEIDIEVSRDHEADVVETR
jgi:hypothetical protein